MMMAAGRWFPAKDSTHVVGRFVDGEATDIKKSEERGTTVYKAVPILESKIVGSHDISAQRVKDGNRDELVARFPGAWESYLEESAAPQAKPETISAIGTPISELDFIPRQNLTWLRELGFSTAEQIRDMSDTVAQGLGRGAITWRKKAKEFLERT